MKAPVRRYLCIFLLMLLPLHTFAMQGAWLSMGNTLDIAHEIEHAQNTGHHHKADGSVHYDESDESTQHASDHSCFQQMATLPSDGIVSVNSATSSAIALPVKLGIRDGFPERPQRPPSALG